MWAMLSTSGRMKPEDQVEHDERDELAQERRGVWRSRIGRWMRSAAISRPNSPKIAPDAPTPSGAGLNANVVSDAPAANTR